HPLQLIDDYVLPLAGQLGKRAPHRLNAFRAVSGPVLELGDHANRFARAKGAGGVAGKLLVRDIGIVFNLACRFDNIDAFSAASLSELSSPRSGRQGLSDVDVPKRLISSKVGGAPGSEQIPRLEVRFRSVQISALFKHFEG